MCSAFGSKREKLKTYSFFSMIFIFIFYFCRYGAILEIVQGRQDVLEKIKGCVFDSGAAEPFNPQVFESWFPMILVCFIVCLFIYHICVFSASLDNGTLTNI